jgi:uncharacterized protein
VAALVASGHRRLGVGGAWRSGSRSAHLRREAAGLRWSDTFQFGRDVKRVVVPGPPLVTSSRDPPARPSLRSLGAPSSIDDENPGESTYPLTGVSGSSSKEPDMALAETIARRGCILRGLVGSTVHGLSNPGTDDRDEMGVCVEPPEYVTGLRPFEHWVYRTQPDGIPSGPGDLDLTIYGLRKYCRKALKGSPTVLLLLFIEGEHVLECTPLGRELQDLAPAFVSRRAGRAFLGYVDAQRRGLLGERHATRSRELSPEYGYDTKCAMHALRIAHQGSELLSTGRITLPIASPERERLLEVRRGELPLREVLDRLHAQAARFEFATLSNDLPDAADADAVDRFLVDAYSRAWAGELDVTT